jgi:hypothetical protein
MGEKRPIDPGEFTRRMDEGEGAGPGAPETQEPRQGRPGAGGHGPKGPGGAGPERVDPPQETGDDAN